MASWGGCMRYLSALYTPVHSSALFLTGSCGVTFRFTYEVAPVFVLLEYVTLKKMREIIGWEDGCGDGIFSPGTTSSFNISNSMYNIKQRSFWKRLVVCVGNIPAWNYN